MSHTKFLGVYVDEDLNWKYHASQISLKVSKCTGVINRVKHVLTRDLWTSLYFSLVQPYFVYCNIVWGGASQSALYRLTCLQKRPLRMITFSEYRAPSNSLFCRLGILKLYDLYKMNVLIFMYKMTFHLLPLSSSQLIQFSDRACSYNFRKKVEFKLCRYQSKLREESLGIVGPKLWHQAGRY